MAIITNTEKNRWKGFLKVTSESPAQSRASVKVGHGFSAPVQPSLSPKMQVSQPYWTVLKQWHHEQFYSLHPTGISFGATCDLCLLSLTCLLLRRVCLCPLCSHLLGSGRQIPPLVSSG